MTNKHLIVLALMLLGGCATIGDGAPEITAPPDVSIVKGSFNREGAFTWIAFGLDAINGNPVPYGLFSRSPPVKLVPGKYALVVLGRFNNGIGAPSEARISMEVELEPGITYEINGKASGAHVEAWLNNVATKEKTSLSFSAPWNQIYQAPTVIKLPAR